MKKRVIATGLMSILLFLAFGNVPLALSIPKVIAEGNEIRYVVGNGDTLSRIALQHGTTVEALMRANGLTNPNYVWVGQQLVIPSSGSEPQETAPPSPDHVPLETQERHVVAPGETLFGIALQYGTTVSAIVEANALSNPQFITVGQVLEMPRPAAVSRDVPAAKSGPVMPDAQADAPEVFRITFYCLGGWMASGRWVYLGAAASDQSTFPLGTRVHIQDLGTFVIEDRFSWTGSEKRLDVWRPSCAEARQLGVMYKGVTVVGVSQ